MPKTSLAKKEIHGLLSLLREREEKTLELIANQVKDFDHQSLRALDDLAHSTDDEKLVGNWYHVTRLSIVLALKEWLRKPDLEQGLYILARLENPGIDETKYHDLLNNYAMRVESRLNPQSNSWEKINALNEVLFREENYLGNQISYYDLKNNFIDSVMDNKTGNPIVISSIYIMLAKRLGIEIQGVGTPGHFIVKHEDTYLDPFFAGREITRDECHIRAQELGIFWKEEYLDPIDDSMIISRSLRNLIAIYKKQNELEKAADASEMLRMLG